jgi:beta-glucanase (GH16 family)
VTVTSAADTTKSASATVTVQASASYAFDDEFNGTAIDTTQWYVFDRRDNWGGSDCFHPANITEANGVATITSRKETIPCTGTSTTYNYTSGQMSWLNFNYTYGTLEFRAKSPVIEGEWPALWMLGWYCQPTGGGSNSHGSCNWPQPNSDEIDVFEVMQGDQPDPAHPTVINQQLHTGGHDDGCKATTTDISQNWHVYRFEWSAGLAVWKIDGVTTCSIQQSYVPSTPMYLMIDTYMGSAGGSVVDSALPQTLQVDYVRVTTGSGGNGSTVSLSVSPTATSLATGASQQFTATVTGSSNTAVTWSASGGSVSSSGLYTAPSSAGTYTVKATSAADTTKSASATVTASTPVQHSATLNWTASTTATVAGYNIYRSTVSGGPYTMINSALGATTNYTDFTVQSGQTYYYVVTAVDSAGVESGFSAQTVAVIPFP